MSLCLNPECENINPPEIKLCQFCGNRLLLGDRYRALQFLGKGGFGRTFKAIDEQRLDTFCVIKQFLPQLQESEELLKATELFKKEAIRLKDLGKHPQIPDLLAFFQQDKHLYLIQEFIDGKDLLKELQQKGKFDEEQIIDLLSQLLPVLDFIHKNNIIHRDIKPDNIIRDINNCLMLIDFGVSKQLSDAVMMSMGTVTGTLSYAAPEQMQGQAFPASDIYSLGVTCIRLLTGCLLHKQNCNYIDNLFDFNEMKWVWRQYVNISDDLGMILDKMISLPLSDRYKSAQEIWQELNVKLRPQPSIFNPSILKTQIHQSSTATQFQITLESQKNIDYTPLQDLLAAGKWKEADEKTYRLLLKAAHREREGYLDSNDWLKFPSKDLHTIDQLWVKYSLGHFGFSVQKNLWQSKDVGGHLNADDQIRDKFGDQVGWRKGKNWLLYIALTFNLTAPKGHLPAFGFSEGVWMVKVVSLGRRWESLFWRKDL